MPHSNARFFYGTGMTYQQLTRKLRVLGCQFKRQSKGNQKPLHRYP
jgi:hypothetical protein